MSAQPKPAPKVKPIKAAELSDSAKECASRARKLRARAAKFPPPQIWYDDDSIVPKFKKPSK